MCWCCSPADRRPRAAAGRTISFGHTDGRLTTLSGPPNRTVTYDYDAARRPDTVIDAAGETWAYTYDAARRQFPASSGFAPGTTTSASADSGLGIVFRCPQPPHSKNVDAA
jgi:uncharacterized protein RhaS with RHS repeats